MRTTRSIAVAFAVSAAALPAAAQKVLATGDFNEPGIVPEVVECKRTDDALSLKIRLRNTTRESKLLYVVGGNRYDNHYILAKNRKYLMLRDAEKKPLAPPSNPVGDVGASIPAGGSWTWWAKFQLPPAEVKKIEYIWHLGSPIDEIPCGDA